MVLGTTARLVAGIGAAAAVLAPTTAVPASAVGTPTGNEAIMEPVPVSASEQVATTPYVAVLDVNGNPIGADLTIVGTGYQSGSEVFAMVCDGANPTSAGWQVSNDCDSQTASFAITGTEGQVDPSQSPFGSIGLFRGQGPMDLFNCLAPQDNPNATRASVPNLPSGGTPAFIDPTVSSWGADTVGAFGGGTAPCQIRVSYLVPTFGTSDKFFPVEIPGPPPPVLPGSPLNVALPAGALVLFVTAGGVLRRNQRSPPATN